MKKRLQQLLCGVLCAAIPLSFLTACSQNEPSAPTASGTPSASVEPKESVSFSSEAKGFGGPVSVTLTFQDDTISAVDIVGGSETPDVGGAALEALTQQLLDAQSADIDGVTGATVTSQAVKDAARACFAQYRGEAPSASAHLIDGSYAGSAMGFMSNIETEVTVKDGKISDVRIVSIGDTTMIGGEAAAQLAEAIVAEQSLAVDTISGATVSSNGVLAAVAAALESSGADISFLKNAAVPKRAPVSTELETDIVVIGAGMAGLCAAREASEQGANVIVLEKEGVFGGSTTRSEGFVMGAGTSYQVQHGVIDTPESMYEDMMKLYADEPELDAGLVKLAVDNSASLIDWLMEGGVVFDELEAISAVAPRDIRRAHISENAGDGLMRKIVATVEHDEKIQILMNTPATELLLDNGKVTGVRATNQYGDEIVIHAAATILCSGSYGGNHDLMDTLNPNLAPIYYSGSGDGDGWVMAEAAGAKMIPIGFAAGTFMYFPYGYWDGAAVLPGSPTQSYFDTIQVNASGKRLVNEDAFTFDFGDPLYDSGDKYGWSVVGEAFTSQHPELYESGKDVTFSVNGVERYITYTAETLEELAQLTGMDAATLTATVERYNASCDAGVDEEFGKDPRYMTRVEAPFTAYMLTLVVSDGYSGCAINENAQVLGTDGSPIEGFYAAGACALPQIIGNRYFGCGSLIMTSGVYGRIAADSAVELLK